MSNETFPTITSYEIQAIQTDAASLFLTDTCSILRKGTTRASDGGVADAYSVVHANVPCRFMPMPRQAPEIVVGGKIISDAIYRVSLPWGTDVLPPDRLQIGDTLLDVGPVEDVQTDATLLHIFVREIR